MRGMRRGGWRWGRRQRYIYIYMHSYDLFVTGQSIYWASLSNTLIDTSVVVGLARAFMHPTGQQHKQAMWRLSLPSCLGGQWRLLGGRAKQQRKKGEEGSHGSLTYTSFSTRVEEWASGDEEEIEDDDRAWGEDEADSVGNEEEQDEEEGAFYVFDRAAAEREFYGEDYETACAAADSSSTGQLSPSEEEGEGKGEGATAAAKDPMVLMLERSVVGWLVRRVGGELLASGGCVCAYVCMQCA